VGSADNNSYVLWYDNGSFEAVGDRRRIHRVELLVGASTGTCIIWPIRLTMRPTTQLYVDGIPAATNAVTRTPFYDGQALLMVPMSTAV